MKKINEMLINHIINELKRENVIYYNSSKEEQLKLNEIFFLNEYVLNDYIKKIKEGGLRNKKEVLFAINMAYSSFNLILWGGKN